MKVFAVELWLLLVTVCTWSTVNCDPEPQQRPWGPTPTFPGPGPTYPRPNMPGPTFPLPGPGFPRPGPGFPGPGFPRPGPGFPGPTFPNPGPAFPQPGSGFNHRFRRSPQGSVQGGITVPEHGRPQANVDYNQRVFDNGKSTLDTYGGVSTNDGRHFQPHAGATYEYRPHENVVVRGQGSVHKGPGGRLEPQVGLGVGVEW